MLRGNNKYYLVLLVLFALLVMVEYSSPHPPDLRRTYTGEDKIPYGCNALYRLLDQSVYKNNFSAESETPYTVLLEDTGHQSAYLFINNQLSITKLDCEYLMRYVEEGNDVFFAANGFNNLVADTFLIRSSYWYTSNINDSALGTTFRFSNPSLNPKKAYAYTSTRMEATYFYSFDTTKVRVLATNKDTACVFLQAPWGKGNFYFFSVPDVFSNLHIVNNPNRDFAYKALSYLHADKLKWDEYYKESKKRVETPLQFIFGNRSLYAGYLIGLISLVIFMIFALKRRQRAIAIVEPLPNTTLKFVEVVGSVYYNSRNHKIIAEEKINAFFEFLRSRFSITGRSINAESIRRIVKLSTIPEEDVKKLLRLIERVSGSQGMTEPELIELNKGIENFYKLNKR